MESDDAVLALAALAQTSRLAVYRRLVELGPQGAYAGELAEHLAIPANTLSFHLKTLTQAALISAHPQGRYIRYRADFQRMQALVGFLSDHCCGGQPQLCAPAACMPQARKASRA